ncbi:hypothetical protein C0995_004308 [Termitomyces sp. Mi166|nr:hypothetical protein C0995_004308 [Termitomyces sp. Mi166\
MSSVEVEDLGKKALELSAEAQALQKYLQAKVTNKFCAVSGVPVGSMWPNPNEIRVNPTTNKRYLLPSFEEQVTHHVNKDFFKSVTQSVVLDLQDPNDCTPGLHDAMKFKWSQKTLEEFAKDMFHKFKPSWKEGYQ